MERLAKRDVERRHGTSRARRATSPLPFAAGVERRGDATGSGRGHGAFCKCIGALR